MRARKRNQRGDPKDLDAVIESDQGVTQPKRDADSSPSTQSDALYPWETPEAQARADVKKAMTLYLPERYMRALDWLRQHGHIRSKHAAVVEAVQEAIEDTVEEHTGRPFNNNQSED